MAAHAQDSNFITRRGLVAAAIIALHVLAGWGFASGLATQVISKLAPPIEADIVEEVKKDDEPPPPPPPEMERPPVEVPPPEVSIDLPMETTTAIQDVTDKPPPTPPPPVRVAGSPAKMTRPVNPDDYYPPGSIRREEQGSPVVQACVGATGKLVREPVVTDTSGFPDLDGAAIKVAKATRYAAGTENGVALQESCVKFKVKFILKNN